MYTAKKSPQPNVFYTSKISFTHLCLNLKSTLYTFK